MNEETSKIDQLQRRRRSSQECREGLEKFRRSGLRAVEYSRREGIPYSTLMGWIGRDRGIRREMKFKAVKAPGFISLGGGPLVEVVMGNGKAIKIYRECGMGFLKDLLGML